MDQIVLVAAHEPGRANRVVIEFPRLVRGVPGLYDLVARLAMRMRVVTPKPVPLNDFALGRHRALLILRGEFKAAERNLDSVQHLIRFAFLVKKIADFTTVVLVGPNRNLLIALCNGRQVEVNPALLPHYMA